MIRGLQDVLPVMVLVSRMIWGVQMMFFFVGVTSAAFASCWFSAVFQTKFIPSFIIH
jgi:hypothetical protein